MDLNQRKCYFMCISKNITNLEILNLNGQSLRDCREVEILVITLDRN